MKIKMVDLHNQYFKIQKEINDAISKCLRSTNFINGPEVDIFSNNLSNYIGGAHVIPCGNGTDALQIAMMALNLKPRDEVIVPTFTYAATAEVLALLKLTPIFVDVDPTDFNITTDLIRKAIGPKVKAIVPVHLFGQCAFMEGIVQIAKENNLYIIEDAAQSLGADYFFSNGVKKKAGTLGDIGCTSFFPSKNLGCFGDGGALFTESAELAEKIKMIANHGQKKKYLHEIVGVNSRLDSIQAAILNVKLKYLEMYNNYRNETALLYDKLLSSIEWIETPVRVDYSSHVFHQYTIKIKKDVSRDEVREYLQMKGVPSMVYYPMPLHIQPAFKSLRYPLGSFKNAEKLAHSVLSLPMHTEITGEEVNYISECLKSYKK